MFVSEAAFTGTKIESLLLAKDSVKISNTGTVIFLGFPEHYGTTTMITISHLPKFYTYLVSIINIHNVYEHLSIRNSGSAEWRFAA